jgi:hypothetical protein
MFPPGEKRRPHPRPAGQALPLRSPFQIRTLPAAASSQPPRPTRRIRRPPRSPKEAERRLSSAVNSRGIKSREKAHRPPKLRLRRLPADINPEGGAIAGGMPFISRGSFRVPRQGKGSLKPERKPPPCRPAPRRPLSNPPDEAAGVQLDIASSSSQGFRPSDGSKARCPACRPLRNGLSVRTAAYAAVRNDGAGFTGPRRPIFPKLAGPASGERRHPEPAPPVKGGHRKGGTGGNPRCNRGIRTLSRTLRGPSAKAQERTAQVQIGSAGGNRPPGTRRTETHRILRKAPPGSSGRLPPFRP